MELARFPIPIHPVPVENTIGRVGVLLDFKNHDLRSQRVDSPAGQEHRVARFDRDAMEAFGDILASQFAFKLRAADALFQADEQLSGRSGAGHVPHLRLRFAAQRRGHRRGGMNLQGQGRLGVDDFHQQGKTRRRRPAHSQHLGRTLLHQPMQRFAAQRPARNDALVAGPVADFPGLAYRDARRERLAVKGLEVAPAP